RDPDGVFTAYLGAEHVERLMRPAAGPERREIIEPFQYERTSPLGQLVDRLQLSPSEADLLAVLLACEVDPVAARLVAYLGGNQAPLTLTMELLFEIVYYGRATSQSG